MFFLWVETGVPGVKPPEPVIEVVRHQCLTHKVVHLLVYSFVCTHLTFCLSLAEPNHHWALIWSSPASVFSLKYWRTNQLRIVAILREYLNGVFHCGIAKGLIHRFGNISIPKPVSFENLMAHHDDLEKVDLPVNSAYAQTAKFQEKFRQTGGGNRSWRKARLTILGPKELARIRTHDHATHPGGRCLLCLRSFFCTQSSLF